MANIYIFKARCELKPFQVYRITKVGPESDFVGAMGYFNLKYIDFILKHHKQTLGNVKLLS